MNKVTVILAIGIALVSSLNFGGGTGTGTSIVVANGFELPSPFEAINQECERLCSDEDSLYHEKEEDTSFLINACPKCPEKYSPCNYCCYDGASSLKLRFFGCPGTIVITDLTKQILDDNNCDNTESGDSRIATKVHFVDCDCYDDLIATTSLLSSCQLYDVQSLAYYKPTEDISISYFDICIVSSTHEAGMGPLVDLSTPLPHVIALEHKPYDDVALGDDNDNLTTALLTTSAITFFETTCKEQEVRRGHGGLYAFPLFPGFGKFAQTCANQGFIDFKEETISLPDSIEHYKGTPPTTSYYYKFIDGTSAGFWPNNSNSNSSNNDDDNIFFESSFASCKCLECETTPPVPNFTMTPIGRPTNNYSQMPTTQRIPMPTPSPVKSPDGGGNGGGGRPSFFSSQPTVNIEKTLAPTFTPSSVATSIATTSSTSTPETKITKSPHTTTTNSPTFKPLNPTENPKITVTPSGRPFNDNSQMPTTQQNPIPTPNPVKSPDGGNGGGGRPSFDSSEPTLLLLLDQEKSLTPTFSPSSIATFSSTSTPENEITKSPSTTTNFPTFEPSSVATSIATSSFTTTPEIQITKSPSTMTNFPTFAPSSVATSIATLPSTSTPEIKVTNPPSSTTDFPTFAPSSVATPSSTNTPDIENTYFPSTIMTKSPTFKTMDPTENPLEKPTCRPPDEIISVRPTMAIHTAFPSVFELTAFPNLTTIPPSEIDDDDNTNSDDSDDENCDITKCFEFAIQNCVSRTDLSICLPPSDNISSRSLLADHLDYHEKALSTALKKLNDL